jgi:SagB-type dehydrogenase family enzyme
VTTADDTVRDYHRRTYHRFEGYAAGPEALDWDAQPDPFRRFDGCPHIELPLAAEQLATPFSALGQVKAQPFDLERLGMLFELCFAISAWKAYADVRWALRCNPSSGNLHPTEAYALPLGVEGIEPAVCHYRSDLHVLEQRCRISPVPEAKGVLVGLSSIHWREVWKYGERAFRYSQLDTGHAIAALAYAAAALGWQCTLLRDWGSDDTAALLGLDRSGDFAGVEPEAPEALLWVHAGGPPPQKRTLLASAHDGEWNGRASLLDPRPIYTWPLIDAVDRASEIPPLAPLTPAGVVYPPACEPACHLPAATIIRQRRSAQHFDPRPLLPQADLLRMLDATLPRPDSPPWCCHVTPILTHLVLFVHRVEGWRQGLYALVRRPQALEAMKTAMRGEFLWERVEGTTLPLYALVYADARRAARTLSCHQDIAGDSAFAVAMLGEFDAALSEGPWTYRHMYWEAGMIGQVLYLQAEAAGVRGTGIGCYFDPGVHETLGIADTRLQSMYHFTVGTPLTDARLQTLPPYPQRQT